MIELRSLRHDVETPEGEAWVLIERRDGVYFITGRKNGCSVDADVTPSGFDTPQAAMRAAEGWADLLSVTLIYMRDDP